MIKNIKQIIIALSLLSIISCSDKGIEKNTSQNFSLVDFVNPLMGTDSKFSLSNGNTYPAIAQP